MSKEIPWSKVIQGKTVYQIFIEESHLKEIAERGNEHAKILYEFIELYVRKGKTIAQILPILADKGLVYSDSRLYDFNDEIKRIYDDVYKQSDLLPRRKAKRKKNITYDNFDSSIEYELEDGTIGTVNLENKKFNSTEDLFLFVGGAISDSTDSTIYEQKNTKIKIKNISFILNKE